MIFNGETLRKPERLCSKKVIDDLFENGKTFYCSPFLVVWSYSNSESTPPVQVAFSVPKKVFRLAVTRNLIKRRMREAYRKNKTELYKNLADIEKKIVFILIYRDSTVADYISLEKAVKRMIRVLKNAVVE
jgi:ribonuclease P protein component